MSEPGQPDIEVPPNVRTGVWANHVDVYGDIDELTLDFAQFDPRDPNTGVVVARVVASASCILTLKYELAQRMQ